MIEWLATTLRAYPQLAIFLTLGLGFLIGRIKIGAFQLGSVTAVLIVGVVVGQLDIPISGPIKAFFFMLFLFSIGYSVGPDFFRSLRGEGSKQALFAVLMSMMCAGVTLAIAWMMGYGKGATLGMFAGSQTCSGLLGVGSEAIQKLGLPEDVVRRELDIVPVCYAVTYIFGTLGTVILLGNFGPKLLGGLEHVKAETAALERKLEQQADNNQDSARRHNALRAGHKHGRPGRDQHSSDLAFVGLSIFVGGLFGLLTLWVRGIPLSFGVSAGALLGGLVFGWLHGKRPAFGYIPRSAVWILNNLGLNVFIAVIGITAAPSFVTGLKSVGPMLLLVGAVATVLPVLFGLWLGHRVFKFSPAITLGCCAGTRTCTAALGAAQTAIGSSLPAIGYAVTYAVSNIMLVVWGLVAVLIE